MNDVRSLEITFPCEMSPKYDDTRFPISKAKPSPAGKNVTVHRALRISQEKCWKFVTAASSKLLN